MAYNREQQNKRFYDALRNSQPLALLCSLSFIISAFTFEKIPTVYDNAVPAGIMFFLAFFFSLLEQTIIGTTSDNDHPFIHWSKFFFLGLGIIYLGLIALEFSESEQIGGIMIGWILILLPAPMYLSSIYDIKKLFEKNRIKTRFEIPIIIIGFLGAISFSIFGLSLLSNSMLETSFELWYLFFVGGGLMGIAVLLMVLKQRI